jgi:gp16 family phage-associated protein
MESCADKTISSAPLPDPARVKAARARLAAAKISVRRWSRENGETSSLVHKVLSGKRPCILGASRRIAEKLGIVGDASIQSDPPVAADFPSSTASTVEAGTPIDHCDRGAGLQAETDA